MALDHEFPIPGRGVRRRRGMTPTNRGAGRLSHGPGDARAIVGERHGPALQGEAPRRSPSPEPRNHDRKPRSRGSAASRLRRIGRRLWPLAGLITLAALAAGLLAGSGMLHLDHHGPRLPAVAGIVLLSTAIGGGVALGLARRVDKAGATGQAAHIDACDRERTVLAAGVAHELRTPLTILKGRLHGLEDGIIEPSSGEAGRLLRQVEHLLQIVGDLNALAHADAGALTLDRRLIDLGDLLGPVVADLRAVLQARGVRFSETYAPALVHGDPVRLVQIFTNILTNAIKHAPQDCEVGVVVSVTGRWVVARILDEGPGFAPGDEARLFTPFWRAAANHSAGRPGSGMGLSLAAKLAEAHGGHIKAENRQDRPGACFSVWLPLA